MQTGCWVAHKEELIRSTDTGKSGLMAAGYKVGNLVALRFPLSRWEMALYQQLFKHVFGEERKGYAELVEA